MLHKTPARELNYDPAEVKEISSAFELPNFSLMAVLKKASFTTFVFVIIKIFKLPYK